MIESVNIKYVMWQCPICTPTKGAKILAQLLLGAIGRRRINNSHRVTGSLGKNGVIVRFLMQMLICLQMSLSIRKNIIR